MATPTWEMKGSHVVQVKLPILKYMNEYNMTNYGDQQQFSKLGISFKAFEETFIT
jgi:hypothetical protein